MGDSNFDDEDYTSMMIKFNAQEAAKKEREESHPADEKPLFEDEYIYDNPHAGEFEYGQTVNGGGAYWREKYEASQLEAASLRRQLERLQPRYGKRIL